MHVGGREFNFVRKDYREEEKDKDARKKGIDKKDLKFDYVSDKGGSETEFLNIGTINEQGEFIPDKAPQGRVAVIVQKRGAGSIYIIRAQEDPRSTASGLLALDKEGNEVQGVILEPKGPSTAEANKNQRIPEGVYQLVLSRDRDCVSDASKIKYPNNYVLYNDQVSDERGITIHTGNYSDETQGCLMPGKEIGIGEKGKVGKPKDEPQRVGYLRTITSDDTRKDLEKFIRGGLPAPEKLQSEELRALQARLKALRLRVLNVLPVNKGKQE